MTAAEMNNGVLTLDEVSTEQNSAADENANGTGKTRLNRVKNWILSWFPSPKEYKSDGKKVRMPAAITTCLVTIAVSLLLIVTSSAMTATARRDVNYLNTQVNALSAKATEMEQDLENSVNLLHIRETAINEYGMINEEYITKKYLSISANMEIGSYSDQSAASGIGDYLSSLSRKSN
ncbi:MAG: hypothetical protein IJR83_04985 [Clostridia bacterium]|nr:hypothetical protein [Clostridia bacterium]